MQRPPVIVFRNAEELTDMRPWIDRRVAKLEEYFDRITGCRVTIEGPEGSRKGGRYRIHLEIGVPRTEIVVSRQADADPRLAIRGAFDAADRQLEDYARRLRGEVKAGR